MVLKFLVKYQTLYLLSRDPVIADSSGYLQANFIFSDDWEGTNKTAQFKRTESTLITDGTPLFFNEKIDSNGNCIIPWEVLRGEGTFNVNVYGQKTDSDGTTVKTITVNSVDVPVGESGLTKDMIPQDSTPSRYDNIYEEIKKAQAAVASDKSAAATSEANASKSASNASTSATNAKASETAAGKSATAAATSATNAANSAKAAANSAREQQADWNVTDSTSKAFIKNKPDVLLKSGGTMTGSIQCVDNGKVFTIGRTVAGHVDLCWGWAKREGAGLGLRSTDYSRPDGSPGEFTLFARDANNSCSLTGKPDGTLTWNSQPLLPVGIVQAFAGTTIPSGWLLCDGSAVSRTDYAALYAVIGTTYGAGNGSTTFNLPNLIDKFVEGSATAGTVKSAGLPNITGTMWANAGKNSTENGAIKYTASVGGGGSSDSNTGTGAVNFDASRSNSIYGKSSTVQPPALTMRYIIKY